ncbi:hypothetical protein B0T24DRAFT_669728 [Lasiosphaeria ovina]|uniref:NB-ARC domain-containing protein n=1 Tax=Lasiosphaeria ovina TaxID=92902 RepID=A0AAE0JWS8_9PEZI|nr:hypothetical protein B0T24DRAFT_669728 [Lasiosphaeria ovina]
MENNTGLFGTFDYYQKKLAQFDPDDLSAIQNVVTVQQLADSLDTIPLLPATVKQLAVKLQNHLDPIVSAVSQFSGNDKAVQGHIWGSIYTLAKVSSEVLSLADLSHYDVLQLLYNCAVELPRHLNYQPDSKLNKLGEEIYSTLVVLCAKLVMFLRDNQHVVKHWSALLKDVEQTKQGIKSLSKKVDEAWHNVALPGLLEGKDKQIKDLISQMTLERRRTSGAPVDCIPPILNQFFEGRTSDLSDLHKHLGRCGSDKVFASIALSGFPGAGKTQLALHLAESCLRKNGGGFSPVLWICAAGPDKIEQDVCHIASQLGILPEGTSPAERGLRAKQELMAWLTETDHAWMIIFDNLNKFSDLKDCWPPARPNCAVVISSRDHSIGGTSVSHRHRVNPLNVHQTAGLILSILSENPDNHVLLEAAKKIGEELGGLPLAVTQIASYILDTGVGLTNFLRFYRARWKRIHQSDVHIPDYEDYKDTLTNIWSLQLQDIDLNTKILEEIVAFLQPDKIPVKFFTGGDESSALDRPQLVFLQDNFEFLEAKKSLERGALLQSDRGTGDIQIHRLIQLIVLDSMEKDELDARFEDAVTLVKRAFPRLTSATIPNAYKSENWHLAQECLAHVWTLEELYHRFNISLESMSCFPMLLSDTSWYLYETGQFERAKDLLKTAEAVCEGNRRLGASTRSIRALIYHHQNLQREAKTIWEENLALRLELDGPENFLVGQNLCNLGAAYGELGDMERCRDFFERGQAHREKYHPDDLSDLALHDVNFTSYLIHNGDLEEAEVTIQRALTRYRRCETTEGFGHNQALFFLAKLRTAQRRYQEAYVLHTQVLTVRRKIMRNHYYTCVSFYHTADVADLDKDHDTAVALLELSLKAFESIPEARNYVARSFFRLSCIYTSLGRNDDARINRERAQGILSDLGAQKIGTCIEHYEETMPIRFR